MQHQSAMTESSSLARALVRTVQEEGVRGFYRGITAAVGGAGPAHAIYYAVYELTKETLGGNRPGHRPATFAVAGEQTLTNC